MLRWLYRFGHLSATWLVACTSEGLLVRSGNYCSLADAKFGIMFGLCKRFAQFKMILNKGTRLSLT